MTVRQTGQFPETYPTQKNERGDSKCLGRVPSWARQHFQALFSRKDQVLNNSIKGRGEKRVLTIDFLAQKALELGTLGEKSGQAPSK